jgi:hypothetical protein
MMVRVLTRKFMWVMHLRTRLRSGLTVNLDQPWLGVTRLHHVLLVKMKRVRRKQACVRKGLSHAGHELLNAHFTERNSARFLNF